MVEAIFKLDLDPIKLKLMDKREGHGWTRAEADRHELAYRRFLALLAKFPDQVIAPDTNVDKFWHAHILDTMKYAEDCEHVFGYFLHHFPYFGMRDEEDAANLAQAARNMQRLYQQEFDDAGAQDAGYCGAVADKAATAYCGVAATAYCGVASDKTAAKQEQATAYCGAAAGKTAAKPEPASAYCGVAATAYCGVASDKAAAKPEQATAYCGVVAGKGRPSLEQASAYCGVAAGKPAAKAEDVAAYCGVANVAYCGVVAGKGRPKLEQAAEAGAA